MWRMLTGDLNCTPQSFAPFSLIRPYETEQSSTLLFVRDVDGEEIAAPSFDANRRFACGRRRRKPFWAERDCAGRFAHHRGSCRCVKEREVEIQPGTRADFEPPTTETSDGGQPPQNRQSDDGPPHFVRLDVPSHRL